MRWYADDSDLRTIKDLRVPNTILFGGIAVDSENEVLLRNAVESAKEQYGHKRAPIKWNFKDLEKKYTEQNQKGLYDKMLGQMFEVRRSIFDAIKNIDFTIIVSIVVGYSSDRKILIDLKSDLARHVFTNGLMRFSQHVKETSPNQAEVILDWPDGSNSKPFDIEYAYAYNNGKSKDSIPYHSGSLETLKFLDSVVYTRMPHSTLMQLSDIIIGATRELVLCALNDEQSGHGVKLLESIAHKYRGYPNNVLGRGLIVNSGAIKTKELIGNYFRKLYVNNS